MDMPGRFPDDPYISDLEPDAPLHELPASTPSAARPPDNGSISELASGSWGYGSPAPTSSAGSNGTPLTFKASPVEWHLPTTPLEEDSRNQTNNSGRRPSAGKRKPSNATKSSTSEKPIAIAVFGVTGTGKSSFVSTLTGKQVGIGHGLKSCTSEIEAVQISLDQCNIALVDTPGFDDTHRTDTDVLRGIASWLAQAYDEKIPLAGVIYLHRISDVRMSGTSYSNLKMLRSLCGRDTLSNVVLASTMWDKVTPAEGEKREKELLDEKNFWGQLKEFGAKVWRYDSTQGTAIAMVKYLLHQNPVVLRIQRELAVEKKALIDTSAGKSIRVQLEGLEKKVGNELAVVKQDLTQALRHDNFKNQRELLKLQQSLEEQKKELEESRRKLRMPINKRTWWQLSWRCVKCHVKLVKEGDGPLDRACLQCGHHQKFV